PSKPRREAGAATKETATPDGKRETSRVVIKKHASPLGCSVCGPAPEQASADLCLAHARALDSVRQAYEAWAKAFGSIGRADFLKRGAKQQGTGKNARQIVEFVQQRPERWQ